MKLFKLESPTDIIFDTAFVLFRLLGQASPQQHLFFCILKISGERNPSWSDPPTRAPSPTSVRRMSTSCGQP